MYTNNDYILREIAGEYMLVPTGKASQNLNGMIHLTETAAFIWKQVDTAKDLQEIVNKLVAEYDVDETTAKEDVYGFLSELYARKMVLDIPELNKISQENFGEE